MATYRVLSHDGFEVISSHDTLADAQYWAEKHGEETIEYPDGRIEKLGRGGGRAQRQADYEAVFGSAPVLIGPTRRNPNTYAISSRRDSQVDPMSRRHVRTSAGIVPQGRNGTNHQHPPGRTRCPKCGV